MVDAGHNGTVHILQPLKAMKGVIRFNPNNLNVRVFLLQVAPGSHQGAAGPHACHKVGNLLFGLPPQLRPGCLVVGE